MTPSYEVVGEGWRISFQRRVGQGTSTNGGALPLLISTERGPLHILVPLLNDETVWVAIMCSVRTQIRAQTSAGEQLPLTILARHKDDALAAIEEFVRDGRRVPIDASTVDRKNAMGEVGAHLSISIASKAPEASEVLVTFVTPKYYEAVTGVQVSPTSTHDAFDGRLLP